MTALDEVWISTQEVARLLQISVDATRRRLGRYETREVEGLGRGGKRLEIRLSSLGPEAMSRWESQTPDPTDNAAQIAVACATAVNAPRLAGEDPDLLSGAFERAPKRLREHFNRRFRILTACEDVEGRQDLTRWVEKWNAAHPDDQVSCPTIYRWRQERQEHGLVGYLSRTESATRSTVRDDWFQWFRESYLDQSCISAPMARMVALGKAVLAGQDVSADRFPSHWAFLRRLESEMSPAVVEYARKGRKRWYDRHGSHVERDYSKIPAGQVWVGDTHTIDVFVRAGKDPVPQTCYLTAWFDMKSYLPMGWHIHLTPPSAENVMRAFKHGVERFGIPSEALVDNGREFKNKDFAGITHGHKINLDEQHMQSLVATLGVRIRFAMPKNARAKIIERNFLEFKNKFSRFHPTFKGGNVLEKPERIKEVLKRGEIPLFEDLVDEANTFLEEILPAIPCHGQHHNGMTRAQLYASESPSLARATEETLSRLVSRTVSGKIKSRGFYLAPINAWWWADWMSPRKGEQIDLRYDPEDLRTAWCYEAKGPFIGAAQLREAIDALVSDDDLVSKARLALQQRQMRGEEKILRNMFPQQTAEQARGNLEALGAAFGAAPMSIQKSGPILLTEHDHVAAKLKREKRLQKIDITALAATQEERSKPELRWYDDQIAAAG